MGWNSDLAEMDKKLATEIDKYTYFLLTAAGAGIGFVFQKTEGADFSWWLTPIGVAALCWSASFCFGCISLRWAQYSTRYNYDFLLLEDYPESEQIPEMRSPKMKAKTIRETKDNFHEAVHRSAVYSQYQFYLLVAGAICLMIWRITEMARIHYHLGQ
jgi:hypothetical protein